MFPAHLYPPLRPWKQRSVINWEDWFHASIMLGVSQDFSLFHCLFTRQNLLYFFPYPPFISCSGLPNKSFTQLRYCWSHFSGKKQNQTIYEKHFSSTDLSYCYPKVSSEGGESVSFNLITSFNGERRRVIGVILSNVQGLRLLLFGDNFLCCS